MYKYKEMIELAQSKGLANEKKMWQSVESLEPMLEILADEHPEEYDAWMAKQHEIMFGPHFCYALAEEALADITYTDRQGAKKVGPHWTIQEVVDATRQMHFPEGTTDADKWVAFNVWYADLGRDLDDSQILRTAYRFFFADEDAKPGKVWRYMKINS